VTKTPANGANGKTAAAAPAAQAQAEAPPPMFYTRPEPVRAENHAGMSIRPEFDFSFAAHINTVPVTVPEFMMIGRHYPIMFLGPELVPTAALGFNPQLNLFVNAAGEWAMGQYVPAYVRRYPFILLGAEGNEFLHLGIDGVAASAKPGARALFENAEQTETTKKAVELCEQFHQAYMFTREFSKALLDAGVIEERALEIETSPGQKTQLGSFQRVSEDKFRQLPDATVLEWFKKGYLYAVYFHLQSMNNWELLMARNALVSQAAGTAAAL
jgi:hypothetical protein